MTPQEAYRVLRRYEDWCIGKDCLRKDIVGAEMIKEEGHEDECN